MTCRLARAWLHVAGHPLHVCTVESDPLSCRRGVATSGQLGCNAPSRTPLTDPMCQAGDHAPCGACCVADVAPSTLDPKSLAAKPVAYEALAPFRSTGAQQGEPKRAGPGSPVCVACAAGTHSLPATPNAPNPSGAPLVVAAPTDGGVWTPRRQVRARVCPAGTCIVCQGRALCVILPAYMHPSVTGLRRRRGACMRAGRSERATAHVHWRLCAHAHAHSLHLAPFISSATSSPTQGAQHTRLRRRHSMDGTGGGDQGLLACIPQQGMHLLPAYAGRPGFPEKAATARM